MYRTVPAGKRVLQIAKISGAARDRSTHFVQTQSYSKGTEEGKEGTNPLAQARVRPRGGILVLEMRFAILSLPGTSEFSSPVALV